MTSATDLETVLPLTPSQQGLLVQTVADTTAGVYVNQVVVTLDGPLRPAVLRASWDELVRRHESLRAAFVWEEFDEPLQALRTDARVPWTELDWSGMHPPVQERKLQELVQAERAKPFALLRPPLMRLQLIRTGEQRWQLLWTVHHLIVDGWSMAVAMNEVLTLYRADVSGEEPVLTEPMPYRDYVNWLYTQDQSAAQQYWQRRFAGFTGPGPTPGARPPAAGPAEPAVFEVRMPASKSAMVYRFCRANRLTPGTVLTAAWGVLLSRYTGRTDIVFGTVVAGRPAECAGSDTAVGLFSTMLPIRLTIEEDVDVVDWLTSVQADLAEARQFEYGSLAQVADWAGASNAAALFDTAMVWENYPSPSTADDSAPLQVGGIRSFEQPHYPLYLAASGGDVITLRLFVDGRRYDSAVAEQMLGHLLGFLSNLATGDPATELAGVALSGDDDRATLMRWSAGPSRHREETTLHERLQRQAERTPDAIALIDGDLALTYREFVSRVNRLGHFLRSQGVSAEIPVAICMPKSLDVPVAVHAVIAAGGMVVPLDFRHPVARNRMVVERAGCPILLVTGRTAGDRPLAPGVRTIVFDDLDVTARIGECPDEPSRVAVDLDNALYALHTSGSTGVPKGVVATHRNVLNYVDWIQAAYPIGPGDRVAQKTSVSFDLSVMELYWPLLTGALLLVLRAEPSDLESGAAEMTRQEATVMVATPTTLDAMLTDAGRRFPSTLRLLVSGGEALSPATLAKLATIYPGSAVNGYGPTETAVNSTAWPLPITTGSAAGLVPIGRPIDNTRCYAVDAQMRPLSAGVPGEMYIGGAGVTRGYLNQPGLTAERFVPDPFGEPGARMYRTGDVVRWLPGGDLDCLGRSDHQVKINGHRIELGEIERTLERHESIQRAVVLVRDNDSHKQLIAYVQPPAGGARTDPRPWLRGRLPVYMVPASVVWLSKFPEMASGKVDRKALPDCVGEMDEPASAIVGPATPAEHAITEAWADVLGITRFGVHDNFFDLGGDSILGLQVVSRAARAGWRVTPRQVLDCQTVSELAAVAVPTVASAGAADSQGSVRSVPLTPIQHWFFGHELDRPGHWNLNMTFAVGSDDVESLAGSLRTVAERLVDRHDALRTRFRKDDDGAWSAEVVAVGASRPPAFTVVSLAGPEDAGGREHWAQALGEVAEEAQEFDLATPPLLRMILVDGGRADRIRLLLIAHHLVMDVVSWRVLLDDVRTCLTAADGQPMRLPPATTTSAMWARELTALAGSEQFLAQAGYWREQHSAGAGVPVDVADAPPVAIEEHLTHLSIALDADRTRQLLREVPRAYHTQIDDVLIAAVSRSVSEISGKSDVLFAVEAHGREQELVDGADLSATVGWFTSLAPLLVVLPEESQGVGRTLMAVKEQRRAMPHRGLGYGLLRYLHPVHGPELAALAGPEISFNNLGQLDSMTGAAPGSTVTWKFAAEGSSATRAPSNRRPYLVDVTAAVEEGALRLTFSYCPTHHQPATMRRLAESARRRLHELVEHCLGVDRGLVSASDFPDSGLDQAQMDLLLRDIR